MIYACLDSFFDMEVNSSSGSSKGKQLLLQRIALDRAENKPSLNEEYNIYQLIINYQDNHVEIWDTMMYYNKDQKPLTMTLEAFIVALNAYHPKG